jgi:hypothetical protein
MVDLTPQEIQALLWCAHTVDLAYGHGPPQGSVLDSATEKLHAELQHPEHRGQRFDTLA